MGSLTGHMISGGLLVFFGTWHVFNVFLAYFRAIRSPRGRFKSRACWPAPCYPNSLFPFEAIFKLGLVLLWGTIEFLVITWKPNHLYGQQGQHGSMEYLIASTGVVDFLVYFNRNNRWPWLPKKADYVYSAFIFLMEKYILANHHPDKTGAHLNIEGYMHMFLVDVAFALAIAVAVEAVFTNQIWVAIMRTYLIVLQGSWLWTIGIVVYYNANLDDKNFRDYQVVALYFAYNSLFTLVYCFVIGILTHACLGWPKAHYGKEDEETGHLIKHSGNGDVVTYDRLTTATDD